MTSLTTLARRTKRLANAPGLRALATSILAIVLVWLVLLPWLAHRPAIYAKIQWLDNRQIDPSAMYYTELEAMKPILRRLHHRQRTVGVFAPRR